MKQILYLYLSRAIIWTQIIHYATYQHATTNVSLATSKSYSFNSTGLGGVLKFNTSQISNYYDGMEGVRTNKWNFDYPL